MKKTIFEGIEGALHEELQDLLALGKLHAKSAVYISCLDVDTEQVWVLRYYHKHNILPKVKEAKEIYLAYQKNKLSLRRFDEIMAARHHPQKVVFSYSDLSVFFDSGISVEEIKKQTLKVLSYWNNNHA